jgi:hypothetical protein
VVVRSVKWCRWYGKRRREEGGLIVVDGRREEEERINKTTKGGREGEASTVDQLPLSPTSAMTRSLTPPRLRGRNLTYQGLSWDLSSNHDTPPGSRLPATSFVLYHVPALPAANGHARVPALTHVRRKDADCPPVRRTYHHRCVCYFCTLRRTPL